MAFKYLGKDRKVEDIVRRSKERGGGYDSYISADLPMYKAREGENTIRLLPASWSSIPDIKKWGTDWAIPIFVHFGIGPDEATYLCADAMNGEPCPVCDERRNTDDPEEAKAMKPSLRKLCWVVDRGNEKAGPQIWAMPASLAADINARSVHKKKKSSICIDAPEDGHDVTFNRDGTDKRTKYPGVEVEPDPSPIHDDEDKQDQWLDYISKHPLPNTLNYYDADYIEKVLLGKAAKRKGRDEEEEEEEEEEKKKPVRKSRSTTTEAEEAEDEVEEAAPSSRRRARAQPEEAGEDEEDDPPPRSRRRPASEPEEEEEDDKPPFKGKRRGAKPAAVEEDEEEEGEEEEEDTPTEQAKRKLSGLKGRR